MKPVFNIEKLEQIERGTPNLLKIRSTHHEVARLLAMGLKDVEVARRTNYSQSRICLLKGDPMFAALVNDYAQERDRSAIDMTEVLRGTSLNALSVLQERLDDDPDSITVKDLTAVAQLGLDRIGYGATTKNISVAVTATATLDQIKARIQEEARGRVLSRSEEPDAGLIIDGSAIEIAPAEIPPGEPGLGAQLREEDAQGNLFPLPFGGPRAVD